MKHPTTCLSCSYLISIAVTLLTAQLDITEAGSHQISTSSALLDVFRSTGFVSPVLPVSSNHTTFVQVSRNAQVQLPKLMPVGFYERLPYDQGSMRSIYHIRESTIRKLSLVSFPLLEENKTHPFKLSSLDIFLSHDWPNTIEQFGDTEGLLRRKKFFREEVNTGTLGSPPLMGLLHTLQPSWWFSAHLHVRFEARVQHGPPLPIQSENPDEIKIDDDFDAEVPHVPSNPEEITLDDEEAEVEAPPPPPPPPPHAPRETRFLALDKCIKNRDFLEVSFIVYLSISALPI